MTGLVTLQDDHVICGSPNEDCSGLVKDTRPLTGQRTVLPVTDTNFDGWYEVRLPGRVFGQPAPPPTGWIWEGNTSFSVTTWRIVLKRKARRLVVFHGDHEAKTFRVVIGKRSTPTPPGDFFIEEKLLLSGGTPGAPLALALSARSRVFTEFDGGPGQVAIHGIANIGGTPGTAASHGCIRGSTHTMKWLNRHVDNGVPIKIR